MRLIGSWTVAESEIVSVEMGWEGRVRDGCDGKGGGDERMRRTRPPAPTMDTKTSVVAPPKSDRERILG